ncbi:MAG: Uma2 family endonuclease [Bryobacteraceae bacterium]|jgi:Uma2 family endonuclease
MLAPAVTTTELVTGERMTVEEFLRSWEELPDLKNAELIDGVVHVSSPVSSEHGSLDTLIHMWLAYYAQATPGCRAGNNSTWLMLDSAPQPDAYLRSHGGQSGDDRLYCTGAPELAVEISLTSTEVDFGPKRKLYQRAGVQEYITTELFRKRLVWHVLQNGVYFYQEYPPDGILRSLVFPGLWLDVTAFWAEDGAKMLAVLNAGLSSEDHQKFVERLAAAK